MENVDNNEEPQSLPSAGDRLRAAREAAGLSRGDLALRTKIAERHLIAIEEDRFGDLAARTYAVGFARSYARAVGISQTEIAEQVRQQLDAEAHDRPAVAPSFEPGDPARVPSSRLAWAAAIGVVVVIGLLLFFWSSYLQPEGALPSLVTEDGATESASPAVASAPTVAPVPAPAPATGPVVLTAAADQVWIKVTDAAGAQVVQKELVRGENWTVPEGASGLTLRTGRPDAIKITVGGREIPALSDKPQLMSVPLGAADLLARGTARPGETSPSTPAAARSPVSSPPAATAEPAVAATGEVPTGGPASPISTESR